MDGCLKEKHISHFSILHWKKIVLSAAERKNPDIHKWFKCLYKKIPKLCFFQKKTGTHHWQMCSNSLYKLLTVSCRSTSGSISHFWQDRTSRSSWIECSVLYNNFPNFLHLNKLMQIKLIKNEIISILWWLNSTACILMACK